MFNIDMNNLKNLSREDLKNLVIEVALHIKSGKDLEHTVDKSVNNCALKALNQQMANPPSEKVLDDLHTLLLISIEKGLDNDKTLKPQLDAIRKIRLQFLTSPSTSTALPGPNLGPISQLPKDAQKNILLQLSPQVLGPVKRVQKSWDQLGAETQISMINDAKIPLVEIFKDMSALEAITWLKVNPACTELRYADFSSMKNFDNDCLQQLVKMCPKLTHLHIPNSLIKGDALKNLQYTTYLQSLDISGFTHLEPDALKNLQYTTALQSLDIAGCKQLEADALKNLQYTTALQSLDIKGCKQLEADALKNLQYTTALQSLNIGLCYSLEPYALKNLQHTTALQSLLIACCDQLEPDALKHLKNTPALQSLDIAGCRQLGPDALKNLQYTTALQSLDITGCTKLEPDALKHLQYTPALQSLYIGGCTQFGPDALKNVQYTTALQSLDITECTQLEPDALKHLKNTPSLQSLDMYGCILERDALKHLKNTPALLSLGIGKSRAELDILENTPYIQNLDISPFKNLEVDKIPAELAFLLKRWRILGY